MTEKSRVLSGSVASSLVGGRARLLLGPLRRPLRCRPHPPGDGGARPGRPGAEGPGLQAGLGVRDPGPGLQPGGGKHARLDGLEDGNIIVLLLKVSSIPF